MDKQTMLNLFTNNGEKKRNFVLFYTTTDRKQDTYDQEWKSKVGVAYDKAIAYLELDDIQNAIKEVYKENRTIKMLDIYDAMCEKALKGDANSAKWIEQFNKSDFFGDTKSAIDKIIDNLDLGE
ncbi:MAG: hypothetical protein AB9856_00950 [Cellulosilyticaceae bacterium]